MPAAPSWKLRALMYVTPIMLGSLTLQYLLGLYTNVNGGFSTNVETGSLGAHFLNGNILFLLSVLVIIFAALAKETRALILGVVVTVMVYTAGSAGMAYVDSVTTVGSSGTPIYSFIMGVAFLVAFGAATLLAFSLYGRGSKTSPAPAAPAAA